VHDVAWAPNLGRSFHQIASASQDRIIRVWRVTVDGGACTASEPVCLDGHHAPVRVQLPP
jgi:nucleoporin SEH1